MQHKQYIQRIRSIDMQTTQKQISWTIGDIVKVDMGFGMFRFIKVENVNSIGKNGKAVIEGKLIGQSVGVDNSQCGRDVWCYLDRVTGVLEI